MMIRNRWFNVAGNSTVMTAILFLAMTLALLSLAVQLWPEPKPWTPLGEFPEQRVLSTTRTVLGPSVWEGGFLIVEAKKCYLENVEVKSVRYFKTRSPSGTVVEVSRGGGMRDEGCDISSDGLVGTQPAFRNPIPVSVVCINRRLINEGMTPKWVMTGEETPYRPNGETGVPVIWTTEEFRIVQSDESHIKCDDPKP